MSFGATLYPGPETVYEQVMTGKLREADGGRAYVRVEVGSLAIQSNCWEDMQRLVDALTEAIGKAQAAEGYTVETFTCKHCGAQMGIAGTSTGSDDDTAADKFYNSEVGYHELGRCIELAEPAAEFVTQKLHHSDGFGRWGWICSCGELANRIAGGEVDATNLAQKHARENGCRFDPAIVQASQVSA